jgi:hypothetical protein
MLGRYELDPVLCLVILFAGWSVYPCAGPSRGGPLRVDSPDGEQQDGGLSVREGGNEALDMGCD